MSATTALQIFVKTLAGKSSVYNVTPLTKGMELKQLISEREGYPASQFHLVAGGKPLHDDRTLADCNVQRDSTVMALMRMLGGGLVELDVLFSILSDGLDEAMAKATKTPGTCLFCDKEDFPCVKLCCMPACSDCVISSFRGNNMTYNCPCGEKVALDTCVPSLKQHVGAYREIQDLLKHIDVQICNCGAMCVNEDGRSSKKCIVCKRIFCFFCNKDWNTATMKNQNYKCGDGCIYATALAQTLVKFQYGLTEDAKIPNQRVCPNCFVAGAYDMKCKYHKCGPCGHTFCFMCLKPEAECAKSSNYNKTCTIVPQTYHSFPHFMGTTFPLPPAPEAVKKAAAKTAPVKK